MTKINALCLSLSVLLLSACGGGGSSSSSSAGSGSSSSGVTFQPITASTCSLVNPPTLYPLGNYAISNDPWGIGNITTATQCISGSTVGSVVNGAAVQTGVSASLNWNWPFGDFSVKSYPEIFYRPNGQPTSIQISALNTLSVNHNVSVSATGDYDVAYDIWVDAVPVANLYPHMAEVMIKVAETWADTPIVDNVTIGGVTYDVVVNTASNNGYSWPFLVFAARTPLLNASLQLQPFFAYLTAHGYLSSANYINSIEFGAEVVQGVGTATIHSYSVTP